MGAIHGPWISVEGIKKRFEDVSPEEIVRALEQEQEKKQESTHEQADAQQMSSGRQPHGQVESPHSKDETPARKKKPRKIEIRSQQPRSNPQGEQSNTDASL